ncbi:hypothetical protein JCGZ_19897 [Jatropha curcas]|uniref:Glycosyltransferase n=1 Tax=Jatropha curcas TaxID=180498 RepID=A0A067JWP4_JATCU|nr:UDP-glycosyltransferase 13 [Jatropha curcas]KDP27198.1 hypothetical protein JCGZ_19897 [Jatropha curcas]
MSSSSDQKLGHIALLPSSGMGHLTPFFRLAALLSSNNVKITFITPNSTVSMAESQTLTHFFASLPHINQKQFHLLPLEKTPNNTKDPFYCHMDCIRQSAHFLSPTLASLSPPLSAVITDMSLAAAFIPITQALNLPNYVLFTSSAKMLTLFLSYHTMISSKTVTDLNEFHMFKIPGLEEAIPRSWIPPPLLENTNNSFKTYFVENGKKMVESSGILVNTFDSIEQEAIRKLNDKVERLPPVVAIGPLAACEFEKGKLLAWLDGQPDRSVMYVSFGSRTAMSREQIRELSEGLVESGARFLWIVKDKKVDLEDGEDLNKVIGSWLTDRLKEKGLVVKAWLKQEDILRHPAVGGFMSHCGWNSVTEAVRHGVPILAWPQHGDQKINASIVERIGLGNWVKSWGWGGEIIVDGTEIAEKVKEVMESEVLRAQAMNIREEAKRAVAVGGSSSNRLIELMQTWKKL